MREGAVGPTHALDEVLRAEGLFGAQVGREFMVGLGVPVDEVEVVVIRLELEVEGPAVVGVLRVGLLRGSVSPLSSLCGPPPPGEFSCLMKGEVPMSAALVREVKPCARKCLARSW